MSAEVREKIDGDELTGKDIKLGAELGSGVNGDTDHLVVYGIGSKSDIFGILGALTQNTGSNYISDAAMILRTYAENQAK